MASIKATFPIHVATNLTERAAKAKRSETRSGAKAIFINVPVDFGWFQEGEDGTKTWVPKTNYELLVAIPEYLCDEFEERAAKGAAVMFGGHVEWFESPVKNADGSAVTKTVTKADNTVTTVEVTTLRLVLRVNLMFWGDKAKPKAQKQSGGDTDPALDTDAPF